MKTGFTLIELLIVIIIIAILIAVTIYLTPASTIHISKQIRLRKILEQ
ncbi:MAG: prepilin-type N-terminal cleavage/methylation domain-containing protein [Fervidobacterium sp.]|nr:MULTISPECIES: prepilin-type N-terminal cleavage/methylation domain-containing protein [Fervidobacterium]NPU89012.1 prepilin-type N-terminal cleavage/methylation domain-containing protein [Fervidobacterium sp.]QIV78022.1 prepilin-type N-terminal cleavage/methylation domain-containing protein [Fervidobacterium pennivorans subsp. keratinolyticus]